MDDHIDYVFSWSNYVSGRLTELIIVYVINRDDKGKWLFT